MSAHRKTHRSQKRSLDKLRLFDDELDVLTEFQALLDVLVVRKERLAGAKENT